MFSEDQLWNILQLAEKITADLGITSYPIKMLDLIKDHYGDRYFLHSAEFNESADVVTNYYPPTDEAIIFINKNRYKPTLMKRLNFSLAHELGHIVLKHYDIMTDTMSREQKRVLENEADEFAGQFLMPECEIMFMPRRFDLLSDTFYVSQQAVVRRLERIQYRNKLAKQKLDYRTQQRQDNFSAIISTIR